MLHQACALLQGYRDAQCAWLMLPQQPRTDTAAAASAAAAAGTEAEEATDPSSPAAARSAKRAKQDLSKEPADMQVRWGYSQKLPAGHRDLHLDGHSVTCSCPSLGRCAW